MGFWRCALPLHRHLCQIMLQALRREAHTQVSRSVAACPPAGENEGFSRMTASKNPSPLESEEEHIFRSSDISEISTNAYPNPPAPEDVFQRELGQGPR